MGGGSQYLRKGDAKMSETERLQKAFKRYEQEHGHMPSSSRQAVEWAVAEGLLSAPVIDPLDILADRMSRALREQMATDPKGRRYRVNHSVRVTRHGVQMSLWGVLGYTEPLHMEQAFAQRREQVKGDLCQLDTDVIVAKEKDPRIQYTLDPNFTQDVAENRMIQGVLQPA